MLRLFVLPVLLASLTACGAQKAPLIVTVAGLPDGSPIPARYGEDDGDTSPAMNWTGAPAETRAVAILVEDPDAPGGTFVHWVAFDLPPSAGVKEGLPKAPELPSGGQQGVNDFGRLGWNGPAPPPGKVHHYRFTVYALSSPTGLGAGADASAFRAALKGRVLAEGHWTGTYRR